MVMKDRRVLSLKYESYFWEERRSVHKERISHSSSFELASNYEGSSYWVISSYSYLGQCTTP